MSQDELKAFMLPLSTHKAILDACTDYPNKRPSEIIEEALLLLQSCKESVKA